MKKLYIWLAGSAAILVIIVAGMLYTAHFASTVNQTHTAPGAVTVTETPIASVSLAGLQTFQIVPAQTTASYSVYENLILAY